MRMIFMLGTLAGLGLSAAMLPVARAQDATPVKVIKVPLVGRTGSPAGGAKAEKGRRVREGLARKRALWRPRRSYPPKPRMRRT